MAYPGQGEVRIEVQPERRVRRDDVQNVAARLARPGPGHRDRGYRARGHLEHERDSVVDVAAVFGAPGQPDAAGGGLDRHHVTPDRPDQGEAMAAALQEVPSAGAPVDEPAPALGPSGAGADQEPAPLA